MLLNAPAAMCPPPEALACFRCSRAAGRHGRARCRISGPIELRSLRVHLDCRRGAGRRSGLSKHRPAERLRAPPRPGPRAAFPAGRPIAHRRRATAAAGHGRPAARDAAVAACRNRSPAAGAVSSSSSRSSRAGRRPRPRPLATGTAAGRGAPATASACVMRHRAACNARADHSLGMCDGELW